MTKEARLFWKSAKTSTSPKRNRPKKNPALSAVNRMSVFDSKNRRRLGTASIATSFETAKFSPIFFPAKYILVAVLVKFMRFGETFALSIEEQIALAALVMQEPVPQAPQVAPCPLPYRGGSYDELFHDLSVFIDSRKCFELMMNGECRREPAGKHGVAPARNNRNCTARELARRERGCRLRAGEQGYDFSLRQVAVRIG